MHNMAIVSVSLFTYDFITKLLVSSTTASETNDALCLSIILIKFHEILLEQTYFARTDAL